jgi:hypothetical protein
LAKQPDDRAVGSPNCSTLTVTPDWQGNERAAEKMLD